MILYISIYIPPEQKLRVPIVKLLRVETESFQHGAKYAPLLSQRGCCVTRIDWHQAIDMETSWHGPFICKATPPNLGPCALYIMMALSQNMCVTLGSMLFFKYCITGIRRIKSNLE